MQEVILNIINSINQTSGEIELLLTKLYTMSISSIDDIQIVHSLDQLNKDYSNDVNRIDDELISIKTVYNLLNEILAKRSILNSGAIIDEKDIPKFNNSLKLKNNEPNFLINISHFIPIGLLGNNANKKSLENNNLTKDYFGMSIEELVKCDINIFNEHYKQFNTIYSCAYYNKLYILRKYKEKYKIITNLIEQRIIRGK